MKTVRTVLGEISPDKMGVTLPHEHIACYFESFYRALESEYLDKEKLVEAANFNLNEMKEKYSLKTLVDCTPINIGRDMDLLRTVSERTGVNIIASTGFYYTEECMLRNKSEEFFEEFLLRDIEKNRVGMLKFAVENEKMSSLLERMLSAICRVQKETNLPLTVHTNPGAGNSVQVCDFILEKGVDPSAITIGHLSDSGDVEFVCEVAKRGTFLGFDRIYKTPRDAFYQDKAREIATLCERGYEDKILLSHDGLSYSEFSSDSQIKDYQPYDPVFVRLIPELKNSGVSDELIEKFTVDNPMKVFDI